MVKPEKTFLQIHFNQKAKLNKLFQRHGVQETFILGYVNNLKTIFVRFFPDIVENSSKFAMKRIIFRKNLLNFSSFSFIGQLSLIGHKQNPLLVFSTVASVSSSVGKILNICHWFKNLTSENKC